jgi:hypothetical protein
MRGTDSKDPMAGSGGALASSAAADAGWACASEGKPTAEAASQAKV